MSEVPIFIAEVEEEESAFGEHGCCGEEIILPIVNSQLKRFNLSIMSSADIHISSASCMSYHW